ncbi:unnamed protein product, partial [Prorocentrum cordatum]
PFTAQAAQGCRAAPTSREAPSWPWQHGSAPPGRRRGGPGGAVACGRPVPARFRLRGPGGGPRGAGEAHAARPEGGRGRREHAAGAAAGGAAARRFGAPGAPKHAAAAAPKGKGATAAVRQEAGAGLAFARGGAGARAAGPAPRAAGASRGEDLLGQRHGGYVAFGSG